MKLRLLFVLLFFIQSYAVELGVDQFFSLGMDQSLKGKKVGLVSNQTGVDRQLVRTYERFLASKTGPILSAVFSPEHGFFGQERGETHCKDSILGNNIPIYSLYGETRRPTESMLRGLDVIIYDIQDVGSRPYTYTTTLYYIMEEAAKRQIQVIVLDRPNPLGGELIDGSMLEEENRSFIGYIDIPYCHGMTIGELALYFNEECKIKCDLKVVKMKGWKRSFSFEDTDLTWIPTSPYMPESSTPLFYATTGLIGELGMLSIGIGSALPFKIVGAPWILAEELSANLNAQKIAGVHFMPFYFKPQYGLYKGEACQGVLIVIQDRLLYKPVKLQYLILGMVKSLYPKIVQDKLDRMPLSKKQMFCKAAGSKVLLGLLETEKYPAWKMIEYHSQERKKFLERRKKYLLYN